METQARSPSSATKDTPALCLGVHRSDLQPPFGDTSLMHMQTLTGTYPLSYSTTHTHTHSLMAVNVPCTHTQLTYAHTHHRQSQH